MNEFFFILLLLKFEKVTQGNTRFTEIVFFYYYWPLFAFNCVLKSFIMKRNDCDFLFALLLLNCCFFLAVCHSNDVLSIVNVNDKFY
jgi:hypothetical protein